MTVKKNSNNKKSPSRYQVQVKYSNYFYMMSEPVAPVREERYIYSVEIEHGQMLRDILEKVPEQHRASAEIRCGGCGDYGDSFSIEWVDWEPEESFASRVKHYEKAKKVYDSWKKKNRKKIEEHERAKADEALSSLRFSKKHYEAVISEARKKLVEIEGQLASQEEEERP